MIYDCFTMFYPHYDRIESGMKVIPMLYTHTFFLWWGGFLFDDCEEDTWSYDECHHEMSWHFLCINGSETKTLGPSQVVFKHLHCRCPLQPQQRHRRATATSHEGRDSCGDRGVVCCTDAGSPSLGYLDTRQQRRHWTPRYTKTQKSLNDSSIIIIKYLCISRMVWWSWVCFRYIILKYGHVIQCCSILRGTWAAWAAWVWKAKESQDGSGGASQAVSWLRFAPRHSSGWHWSVGVDSWLSRLWSPHSDQHDQPRYLQASLFRRYLNYSIWAYLGGFCDMMWHACLPDLGFAVNDWSQSAVLRGSPVVKLRIFELLQRLHSEGFASKDKSKEGMHQKWAQTSEKKNIKNNLSYPMSQPIMDLHWLVFWGVWYSELDAKAEEQKQKSNVQTALKKLIVFTVFNGFANEEDALPKVAHLAHSPDPLFWNKRGAMPHAHFPGHVAGGSNNQIEDFWKWQNVAGQPWLGFELCNLPNSGKTEWSLVFCFTDHPQKVSWWCDTHIHTHTIPYCCSANDQHDYMIICHFSSFARQGEESRASVPPADMQHALSLGCKGAANGYMFPGWSFDSEGFELHIDHDLRWFTPWTNGVSYDVPLFWHFRDHEVRGFFLVSWRPIKEGAALVSKNGTATCLHGMEAGLCA